MAGRASMCRLQHKRLILKLDLINAIIVGGLPLLPKLLYYELIGLENPDGNGLMPIAIGEVLLRLASQCGMASCHEAGQALAPLQHGVGVCRGSQIIVHALSTGIKTNSDYAILSTDWKHTFNELQQTNLIKVKCSNQLTSSSSVCYQMHYKLSPNYSPFS